MFRSMAPFLSGVTLLLGVAAAGSVKSGGTSAASSISQIRDTLRNLLRSIDDSSRDAEALFGKRQEWCDSAVGRFDGAYKADQASLSNMNAQLTETQAEVSEAAGSVQQVKVDIAMVQHTIKQTQDMLEESRAQASQNGTSTDSKQETLLSSLVDNKQVALANLEGELARMVPVLAQLQATAAETRQKISYRTDSTAAASDFLAALTDGCQVAANRADAQAAARVGEANSVHAALQALDLLKDDTQDNQASAVSFVQLSDDSQEVVTTDDLSDLFSSVEEQKGKSDVIADTKIVKDDSRVQEATASKTSTATSLRPRIRMLLNQLKETSSAATASDQAAWCTKQRETCGRALKYAQDSVAQVKSELDAHASAEKELSEELNKVTTLSAAVTESAKTVLEQAHKESALLQNSHNDQLLATKILDQAMTILKELDMANSAKVVSSLDSAKKMFTAQVQAANGFQKEASAKAQAINEKAKALTTTQESEQHALELARDDHTSQRLKIVESKTLYEADVDEATAFVQKLEENCKVDAESEAEQQRSIQLHALEDADKALDGKLQESKSVSNSLRGSDPSHAKALQNLTPMQRAAAEMGIETDE